MEKLSRALTGLMLALFALALALTLALAAQEGLSRHGLIGALLAAACLTAFILRLRRKRSPELAESLGAGKAALVLSLVFLALNGVWLLCFNLLPEGDYGRFWSDAVSLSRFGRLEGDAALYDALYPHILGYASFLGLLLRLFGEQVAVAEWANLLLSLGIGLALYGICLRLFGLRAACAAFLLWTLCPSKTLYNALVLSEPLYTCLLLAYTLLLGFSERVDRLWAMALLGALAGLILRGVNVARPIAAVCLIALGIWILFLRGQDIGRLRLIGAVNVAVGKTVGRISHTPLPVQPVQRRLTESPPHRAVLPVSKIGPDAHGVLQLKAVGKLQRVFVQLRIELTEPV